MGRAKPPPMIHERGLRVRPKAGRSITSINSAMMRVSSTRPAAAITHHRVATEAATGPAGDKVESSPEQPDSPGTMASAGNGLHCFSLILGEVPA